MKKCFKCGKFKDIEQFYKHKEMADGHLGKCKTCAKKDVNKRYRDPNAREKIREYEKARFKRPERKRKLIEYQVKRRKLFPGKYKARYAVSNAVKNGMLKKLPCEICGNAKSQAHHRDYRKKLDVKWLCFVCHRKEHGQEVSRV